MEMQRDPNTDEVDNYVEWVFSQAWAEPAIVANFAADVPPEPMQAPGEVAQPTVLGLPRLLMDWEIKCYYYPVLPEQSRSNKVIFTWVTFYTSRSDLACTGGLGHYRLRMYDTDPSRPSFLVCELPCFEAEAWVKSGEDEETGQELWQVKLPFAVPTTTYGRAIFQSELVHLSSGVRVELGGSSIVSNTSQRRTTYHTIRSSFPDEAQQRLVDNFRDHSPRRRHFRNGKGGRQGNLTGDRFHADELARAVHLPISSISK
jgi:hypothetical protein